MAQRVGRSTVAGGKADLVVCVACGLGFALLAALVGTGMTARLDGAALVLASSVRAPWLTHALLLATNALGPLAMVAVAAVAMLALARRHVLLNLVTVGGACALNVVLKAAFCRPRPEAFALVAEKGFSFPSGHAMVCTAVLALLWIELRPRLGARGGRALAAVCAGLVALVCASRVYLGAHYPSDVVAGVLAALAWVALMHRLASRAGGVARPAWCRRTADAR